MPTSIDKSKRLSLILLVLLCDICVQADDDAFRQACAKAKTLPRLGSRDIILKTRADVVRPSDVTFIKWKQDHAFDRFLKEHFDWWMFPWRAAETDSATSLQFSVLPGDIADLLLSTEAPEAALDPLLPFTKRFAQSTNALFDALRIGGIDPVSGAHPARRSKIYGSLFFFEDTARFLGLRADAEAFAELRAEFVRLFGEVEEQWYASHIQAPLLLDEVGSFAVRSPPGATAYL